MNIRKLMCLMLFYLIIVVIVSTIPLYTNESSKGENLYDEGIKLYNMSNFGEASAKLEQALKIFIKENDRFWIAFTHGNLGLVYAEMDDHRKAITHYRKAMKFYEDIKYKPLIAASLGNIGTAFKNLGEYNKALDYCQKALEIFRECDDKSNIEISLNKMGIIYGIIGNLNMALQYFQQALEMAKKRDSNSSIGQTLNNMGNVYVKAGWFEKALGCHWQALKIYQKTSDILGIRDVLSNIGMIYRIMGDYQKALEYLQQAVKISIEMEERSGIGKALINIGTIYAELGNYERALEYFRRGLEIFEKVGDKLSICVSLKNIGNIYKDLKDYQRALRTLKQALKISKDLGIKSEIDSLQRDIGDTYLALGDYKKALERYQNTRFLWLIGNVYNKMGKHKEALENYREVLYGKIDLIGELELGRPGFLLEIYNGMGESLEALERYEEAVNAFINATEISEELRRKVVKEKHKIGVLSRNISQYKNLVRVLIKCYHLKRKPKEHEILNYGATYAEIAFYFSESVKARSLIEGIANSARRYNHPELPVSLRKKEENLINQFSALKKIKEDVYKKGGEALTEHNERYKKVNTEMNELIEKLRKEYPKYAALMYPKPNPEEELPLKDNEVLLEYAITDDATYLFKLKKGGVEKIFKIPIGKEKLESLINKFVLPLHSKSTIENFSPQGGNRLYRLLLEEGLKDVLPENIVIIVPDGILGLLPFEALITKVGNNYKDSRYIADQYNIIYSQSAAVLALNRMLKPSQAKKPLFALGNPIYSEDDNRYIKYRKDKKSSKKVARGSRSASFRALATRREWGKTTNDDKEGEEVVFLPLEETEEEVRTIANHFGVKPKPLDVLLGIDANETNFRKVQHKEYHYLHFATHADLPGKIQGINEPFILLGQVENKGKDDGFLTMSEVLGLKLDADMVVLSACQTGRGKVMEGEGVVNFARAFMHAGARSVLVSLWEVATDEAVEYMKLFYGYIKSGKGKAEALRLARKEIKSRYPNPFYWGVFVLHGEGGSLTTPAYKTEIEQTSRQPISVWIWIVVPVIFVLILIVFIYRRKK